MSRNYQEHPELFPWVEEMALQIQLEHNNEFDAFVAKHEAERARCTCEYDGGYGDDGSQTMRFARHDCPVHREEDLDEGVTFCPNCGNEATFTEHQTVHREPYGDFVEDAWLTCNRCKKRTDAEELEGFNREGKAAK